MDREENKVFDSKRSSNAKNTDDQMGKRSSIIV